MNNIRFLYITDMLIPTDKTPAILMRWRKPIKLSSD